MNEELNETVSQSVSQSVFLKMRNIYSSYVFKFKNNDLKKTKTENPLKSVDQKN
jgi:hypothetical protein